MASPDQLLLLADDPSHDGTSCATACTTMTKRPGQTVKLSISLDRSDVAILKKRAKRVSGGNISAAIADTIRVAREVEDREALAAWLGEGREEPSAATMDAIRVEWAGVKRSRRRTKAS